MLTKISVKFENCYGIYALEHTFDLTTQHTACVYAPNGSMKTSFARTLEDYSNDVNDPNPLFPHHTKLCEIHADGQAIDRTHVKVIAPLDASYRSKMVSTLLVEESLRNQYGAILAELSTRERALIAKLRSSTGTQVNKELEEIFGRGNNIDNLFAAREALKTFSSSLPSEISYRQIFNPALAKLFRKPGVEEGFQEYFDTFQNISLESPYLRGGFNIQQLQKVGVTLDAEKYFDASHSITLTNKNDSNKSEVITSRERMFEIVSEQTSKILGDARSKEAWTKLDKAFSTKDDRSLRELLEKYPDLRLRLSDRGALRQEMMLGALKEAQAELSNYLDYFESVVGKMQEIEESAEKHRTEWEEVIEIFKKRFEVPFTVNIADRASVVLGTAIPLIDIEFVHEKTNEKASPGRDAIYRELSQGERRALYLLDVIYDIRARQKARQPTIYVVDDIADSFDYRNKYAIIEYLHDIAANSTSRMVILTHNFDFHRTICSRFDLDKEHAFLASRNIGTITLHEDPFRADVFKEWRKRLETNDRLMIASIAFVRNLADYGGDTISKSTLTELMHIKPTTKSLTVVDLENIYKAVLKDRSALVLPDNSRNVYDLIIKLAETILGENDDKNELESKIILSIASRLLAEDFMIARIANTAFVNGIVKNQTRELFNEYKRLFLSETQNLEILERVNLMTPENIHINSFMFEPILDMSNANLKSLYRDVRDKLK